jgi:hypothetical protein
MPDLDYLKKLAAALITPAILIPGMAMGFYYTYQIVTAVGN